MAATESSGQHHNSYGYAHARQTAASMEIPPSWPIVPLPKEKTGASDRWAAPLDTRIRSKGRALAQLVHSQGTTIKKPWTRMVIEDSIEIFDAFSAED